VTTRTDWPYDADQNSPAWTANYWLDHKKHSSPHSSLEGAVSFLRDGENAERLLADSISGPDGNEIAAFRDLDVTMEDYAAMLLAQAQPPRP
jgi:hypothetical protein